MIPAPFAPAPNFRLDAALSYAARGWKVFPCHWPKIGAHGPAKCSCGHADCSSIGKHPMTPNGCLDASADESQVRAWWTRTPSANVGIATGAASGFFVFDIDLDKGGPESLAALEAVHGPAPATVEVITGGGGSHRLYRHPGDAIIPNSTSKIGPGLDVRGDGGYVVAPPSGHASGQRYSWEICAGPDEAAIVDPPPWLLAAILKRPEPPGRVAAGGQRQTPLSGEVARHWLGKALARAGAGNRNDTGLWLATQLRDNGVGRGEAEATMRDYANRCPAGDHPYTEREAMASLDSAWKTPPRDAAKSLAPTPRRDARPYTPSAEPVRDAVLSPAPDDADDVLSAHLDAVMDGRFYDAQWPWPTLTQATQALLPGSFCLVGGDPGVGKTYFNLDGLRYWHANGMNPAVFFAEETREFYLMRILAQLEGDFKFGVIDWIKDEKNHPAVRAAKERHRPYIRELGKCIWTKPAGKLTLDHVLAWIRDRADEGRRVIMVDPITAVDPGAERWTKDSDFVMAVKDVMDAKGCSVVMATHPKGQSVKPGGTSSGHDAAGGAAYFRFVSAMLWLVRSKAPRRVMARHAQFGNCLGKTSNFVRVLKARNGCGAGWELAFEFRGAKFKEIGVVVEDLKGPDVKDVFSEPEPPHAPRVSGGYDALEDVA